MEKKKNVYLRNKDLLAETVISLNEGKMTDNLARMLLLLTERYGNKSNWVNYSYLTDMKAYAMLMLVRTWKAFKPEVSNNAFAFYTQCVKHSFIQYLNNEKKHRDIRDSLLVDNGLSPSFSFQEDYEDDHINMHDSYTSTMDWDPLARESEFTSSGVHELSDEL